MTVFLPDNELVTRHKYPTKLSVGNGVAVGLFSVKWRRALGRRIPRTQFAQWGL